MSLPWIALYPGAYLKNTMDLTVEQHGAYILLLMECWTKGRVPKQNDAAMARITRVGVRRYRRSFAAMVDRYFNADGTNKRASEEIEKAKKKHEKRALAGRKGGILSGLTRRSKRSKREAAGEAFASNVAKQCSTNQNRYITSSLHGAARETAAVENKRPPRKEVEASKPVLPPGTPVDQAMFSQLNSKRA